MTTIDVPAGAREQTRARYPDEEGYVERDGVRVFWEVYGAGEPTIHLFAQDNLALKVLVDENLVEDLTDVELPDGIIESMIPASDSRGVSDDHPA